LLLPGVSSIASMGPLLGAAAQLKLVQSVLSAMHAADAAAANAGTSQPINPAAVDQPSSSARPVSAVQPRRHIHCPPIVEPRQTVHLRPRIAITQIHSPANPSCAPCPAHKTVHHDIEPTPVWKFLPPPAPSPKIRQVKRPEPTPDISIKGSLIDIFV
jgi:hypothetical protein